MTIELKTKDDASEEEKVELFSIDGKSYFVGTKQPTNVALRYMNIAATKGEEAATNYMFTKMLGEDAYEALMDYDDLTNEELESVMTALQEILLGRAEGKAPKAKKQASR